ncbi:MAG: response regulator [Thiotrichaceae bacterium]|nr:response regulator [Thiotrichaceae bacterium]
MTKPILLIVDDEPGIAKFVGEAGKLVGFDILIANSAKEFKQYYASTVPAGIVLDIVMPDMDGIELINWLADFDCSVPITLMSGHNALYIDVAKKLGIRKGCQIIGTLSKPFSLDELKPLLQKNINYCL